MSQQTPSEVPPIPAASALTSDDRIWAVFCHLSLLLGVGILLPLVVYLVKRDDAPAAAEHAREALNFHISAYLYALIFGLLCFVFIGLLLLPVLGIFTLVCAIIAAVKASRGELYRYPLTLRLVR